MKRFLIIVEADDGAYYSFESKGCITGDLTVDVQVPEHEIDKDPSFGSKVPNPVQSATIVSDIRITPGADSPDLFVWRRLVGWPEEKS